MSADVRLESLTYVGQPFQADTLGPRKGKVVMLDGRSGWKA
jgi:hypothetical protein